MCREGNKWGRGREGEQKIRIVSENITAINTNESFTERAVSKIPSHHKINAID